MMGSTSSGSNVVVIGAGSVGTNAAIFLASLGYRIVLLDAAADILTGAPQVTFINHGDGFEYFKPEHTKTGEHCIEGSLTKALFHPFSALTTGVCSASSPSRFLVASGAVAAQRISPEEFLSNVVHMKNHYRTMYKGIADSAMLSGSDAESVFVRPPETFMRPLSSEEFEDVRGIAAGACGVSFGINMPHYYALLKTALQKKQVTCEFNINIDSIAKRHSGEYEVCAGEKTWNADHVLICSAHHIPHIALKIRDETLTREFPGTYFLNCMTFVRLPATNVEETLRLSRRITFTLMEQYGGMLASVVPPTPEADGLAAIYYPDPTGSQLAVQVCRRGEMSQPPTAWGNYIESGLPNSHPNVQRCFEQACSLYPFLRGYAEISHTICSTVFSAGVAGSDGGQDRRVRELSNDFHAITSDGRVSAWTAPKWTNAELTALMATDYVLERSGKRRLPKSADVGCGPTKLDAGKISCMFNFRDLTMNVEDAQRYADLARLPRRIIAAELPQFQT